MSPTSLVVAMPNSPERDRLLSGLQKIPHFRIVAVTSDLMNTYNIVEELEPKAVLIADSFGQLAEFEVMRAVFNQLDVRWLVVCGFAKPGKGCSNWSAAKSGLFELDRGTSIQVISEHLMSLVHSQKSKKELANPNTPRPRSPGHSQRRILIGASTGGVDALMEVLSSFPRNCPPTLIVQHTGQGFGESLATLLARQCTPDVVLAEDGMPLEPGRVIIGAGLGAHMRLSHKDPSRISLEPGPEICGHMPSVDALFTSCVNTADRCVAAVLTGMGRDGATGLKALRDAGALTVVQDEATSVVAGMPKSAANEGGAQHILPLKQIGPALLQASTHKVGKPPKGVHSQCPTKTL